ncbi:alpha/beta fold hydrolase [Rhizobium lentis]|uniref:Pimeloyl-ACP methyl ester carboxylesterase n=1 Tax=Rhizobium lentis TaxID=1138194 RepID=A0A7W9CWE9_9HYPH|nr:alpha/beta hydrolase [Rhizobium lentis]MBB4575531.1 pimeloyl-ACP methyl ester carboxylesterase [Rhizobium lentis]MBB5551841.1 pimeloyl-ACP methyl ester carboxylesterase [Rhizobium lentis]MBB5562379.1 pimeloyl-ACP methyl ester carboxylesterase [Rhizobium lentis]MBB5568910.1 pimeloyl-ACP methyl ester carboxylesterase [Rhizobium lentis]
MLAEVSTLLAPLAAAIGYTSYKARRFEQTYPNIGELTDVGGYRMNAVHIRRPEHADLPALVFIHGASGNLLDQVVAFRAALEGRAEMLFVDRPGHGYSERGGPENAVPSGQADAIARLMEARGIDRAIIVGHSFGGAITATFGLRHPEKTAGLLFLAPATHPWPGGIDWYYHVATTPVVGWLFNHAIVVPLGLSRLERGTLNVFSPNPRPLDYIEKTGPSLVLRPSTFRNNAADFKRLLAYLKEQAPLYSQITAPTVIITGDSDEIVWEHLHSRGLARDIAGSELITVRGVGHKPDYLATDVAIAAMEKIAGKPRDLQAIARRTEERLAAASPDRTSLPSLEPGAPRGHDPSAGNSIERLA